MTNTAWVAPDCGQGCALVTQSCRSLMYVASLLFLNRVRRLCRPQAPSEKLLPLPPLPRPLGQDSP